MIVASIILVLFVALLILGIWLTLKGRR